MALVAVMPQQPAAGTPHLTVPVDWEALAPLPLRETPTVTPLMTRFVAHETQAGNCRKPRIVEGRYVMHVDVAVLLAPNGSIRATIPRAINCPTIEQYAAGLISSFARKNLLPSAGDASGWYRASVTFAWKA
ncbi:hypothetical protein [Stakelama saccharophila]|uniref:TonB C-terminal domain-containing protein n=1 Tax=Stakelama saccharophila TaxID=3075605 RepID=A0ABZ0B708_9SPHN|nr:hypothetical protein [Stakelama sp. W311]WNO53007.1 hypothetical protein RPR59_11145 [Stakelama sp. W311]